MSAKKRSDGTRAEVHKDSEGVLRSARELLAENGRLRVLLAALENERTRLEERARSTEDVLRELDGLRAVIGSLERDKLRLHERLLATRKELDGHRRERERLERQLAEATVKRERGPTKP